MFSEYQKLDLYSKGDCNVSADHFVLGRYIETWIKPIAKGETKPPIITLELSNAATENDTNLDFTTSNTLPFILYKGDVLNFSSDNVLVLITQTTIVNTSNFTLSVAPLIGDISSGSNTFTYAMIPIYSGVDGGMLNKTKSSALARTKISGLVPHRSSNETDGTIAVSGKMALIDPALSVLSKAEFKTSLFFVQTRYAPFILFNDSTTIGDITGGKGINTIEAVFTLESFNKVLSRSEFIDFDLSFNLASCCEEYDYPFIGGDGTFTPLELSPVGWWDPRDINSITFAIPLVTIDEWFAQPPPVYGADLATPTARPNYDNATINAIQAVEYLGNTNFDIVDKTILDNKPGCTFATITDNITANGDLFFCSNNPNFSPDTRRVIDIVSSTTQLRIGGRRLETDSAQFITTPINAADINIIIGVFDYVNTTITLYLNGVQVAQDTNFQTSGNSDSLSSFFSQVGRTLDGFMGDIIILDYAATLSQVQQLEGFLAHQYEVTGSNLPLSHPYKNFAP